MKTFLRKSMMLAGLLVVMTGCQDLLVENNNAPDRFRALSDPDAIEALVYGSIRGSYWARAHNSSSTANALPNIADEFTATYSNNASLELSSEPRVVMNNSTTADAHDIPRFQWYEWYTALSNANEALFAIEQNNIKLIGSDGKDNTQRGRAFAKFMQGMALGYLSVLFDQAAIADENADLSDPETGKYHPYPEVLAAAVKSLEEGIALAEANTFTTPDNWFPGSPLTNVELAQLMHSFIARFMVLGARTPAERKAINWTSVISHIDKGVKKNLEVTLTAEDLRSTYLSRAQNSGSFAMRADNKLIGPADISGNYQSWLNTPIQERVKFLITTPDRRITGATPTSSGKYFRYLSYENFRPDRGTYHFSYYQWYRYKGGWNSGQAILLSVDEMNLYKAEGLLRTNQAAQAATLINITRVANGELPPATADGVSGANCVPRKQNGACGSLLDALHYERMIELAGMDALRAFLDRRGFGTLTEGTFLQLPVPAREVLTLARPLYTFGGVGGEMAADASEEVE